MDNGSSPVAQTNSLRTVFECVRLNGSLTKKEIQHLTGLSWGSISYNTANLLNGNVFQEKAEHQDGKGRNPSVYQINHNKNWIIGLDVQMNAITGVVLTLDGKVVYRTLLKLHDREASAVCVKIFEVLSSLLDALATPNEVHWIGLSMPGVIEREPGRPMRVHHFYGGFPHDMLEQIECRFGIPADIFHDPDCMLVAHLNFMPVKDYDRDKQSNVLLVRWSYGIGLSMLLNGELYFGDHHAAGEMGHMVINPDGPPCICGQNGCLEVYAAMRSVEESVRRRVEEGVCHGVVRDSAGEVSREDIWQAYRNKDKCVTDIVNSAVDYMAMAIINVATLLDPELIIIEGEFATAPSECIERLRSVVNARLERGRQVEIRTQSWEDCPSVGAAEMVIDRVFAKICGQMAE